LFSCVFDLSVYPAYLSSSSSSSFVFASFFSSFSSFLVFVFAFVVSNFLLIIKIY